MGASGAALRSDQAEKPQAAPPTSPASVAAKTRVTDRRARPARPRVCRSRNAMATVRRAKSSEGS